MTSVSLLQQMAAQMAENWHNAGCKAEYEHVKGFGGYEHKLYTPDGSESVSLERAVLDALVECVYNSMKAFERMDGGH